MHDAPRHAARPPGRALLLAGGLFCGALAGSGCAPGDGRATEIRLLGDVAVSFSRPECEAGARRCADELPWLCVEGVWHAQAACGDAEVCGEGTCRPKPVCDEGLTRCAGDVPLACTGGAWLAQPACDEAEVCRDGACTAPSQAMLDRYAHLEAALVQVERWISNPTAFERAAVLRQAWLDLRQSDDDLAYASTLRRVFNAVPQGHQTLRFDDARLPYQGYTRFGACLRPYGDHFVVTSVAAGARVDLSPGDEVVAFEDTTGEAMAAFALSLPMSGHLRPSPAGMRHAAAESLLTGAREGMALDVRSSTGVRRVILPAPGTPWVDCADSFQRTDAARAPYDWKATMRPDGIGVIHLATFYPAFLYDRALDTEAAVQQAIDEAIASLEAEFDTIRSARGVVWDLRGNQGGLTPLGLAVASGLPGARAGPYTECYHRDPGSTPATFMGPTHHYELTPDDRFRVPGAKVAVIIDGSNYSAADYFPWFVRHATDATLVGSTTSGAFGGGNAPVRVPDARYAAEWRVDPTGCRTADGALLEGQGVEPHISVELEPADLAAGVDTALERAILAVQ